MEFDKSRISPGSMADAAINESVSGCNPSPYAKVSEGADLPDTSERKQAWSDPLDTQEERRHEKVALSSSFTIPFERMGSRRYVSRSFSDRSASTRTGTEDNRISRRRSGAFRKTMVSFKHVRFVVEYRSISSNFLPVCFQFQVRWVGVVIHCTFGLNKFRMICIQQLPDYI